METQELDELFAAMALEELTPEEEAVALRRLEATPAGREALAGLGRDLRRLRRMPIGPVLPERLEVPPADPGAPPLPAELLARLKAIPELEPRVRSAASVSPAHATLAASASSASHSAESPSTESPSTAGPATARHPDASATTTPASPAEPELPAWARRERPRASSGFWGRLSGFWLLRRWELAAGLAAAVALFVFVPRLMPPTVDEVRKGPGDAAQPVRDPAGLSLVGRDSPQGEVYRLPLEDLGGGVFGAAVGRDQTVLPVVQSQARDLSTSPWHVRVLGIDATGRLTPLYTSSTPAPLRRLPGTDHLYALQEPVRPGAAVQPGGRLRLYTLVTAAPLVDTQLEQAVKALAGQDPSAPRGLLDPAFSTIDGLEATLLVEVR